jgi:hypothetical protein
MYCNTHVRFWPEGRCLDCDALAVEQKQRALRETLERAETQRQVAVPDVDPYEEPLNPWWPATDADCGPAVQAAIGAAAGTLRASAKLPGSMVAPEPLRLADFMPGDYGENRGKYAGCYVLPAIHDMGDKEYMTDLPGYWTGVELIGRGNRDARWVMRTDVERVAKQNEISLRDAAGVLAGSAWQELVGGDDLAAVDMGKLVKALDSSPAPMAFRWDAATKEWLPIYAKRPCPIAALKAAGWTLDEVNRAVLSGEVKP